MSNYRRSICPGGTFFITIVTYRRNPFLATLLARQILKKSWIATRRRLPCKVDALCILPDHLHCLVTLPDNDSNYSKRVQMFKGLFSIHYKKSGGCEGKKNDSRIKKGEASLWQRRFWEHMIRDEDDMQKHFDYIHYNPVKHGFVENPRDWSWSTFHKYVRLGYYPVDWCSFLDDDNQHFGE